MAKTTIKRVNGGYLMTQDVSISSGQDGAQLESIVKVGEEYKVLGEILGHIFENYLTRYGDSCEITISITNHDSRSNELESYFNEEAFFTDSVGDYDLPEKKGGNNEQEEK